jgi:branched-chain amino acid transport system permease protein
MKNYYSFIALFVFILLGPFIFSHATVTEIIVFSIVAVATNIMLGYTGLLSFGQAMFFGTGAYISGLVLKAGFPLFVAIPISTISTFILASIVGYFCVQRTGLYFICLSFAFNQMLYFIAYVWVDVTGGEDGLVAVPRPEFLTDSLSLYVFIALIFLICLFLMKRVVDAPIGLVFKLIRENPSRAAAIGYDVKFFKMVSFIIASSFTGLAGSLYVMIHSMAPIDQIHWLKSGDIIFMTLFGGVGHFLGPVMGVIGYIFLSDNFAIIWARWPLLMGILFALVVLYFKGGLAELIEKAAAKLTLFKKGLDDEKSS